MCSMEEFEDKDATQDLIGTKQKKELQKLSKSK